MSTTSILPNSLQPRVEPKLSRSRDDRGNELGFLSAKVASVFLCTLDEERSLGKDRDLSRAAKTFAENIKSDLEQLPVGQRRKFIEITGRFNDLKKGLIFDYLKEIKTALSINYNLKLAEEGANIKRDANNRETWTIYITPKTPSFNN